MTNTIGSATIEVAVDSSGVEQGLARAEGAVQRAGRTLQNFGEQGRTAMDGVGASSANAAGKLDSATKSLIGSIERATAAMQAGKKGSAEYFESLARNRGVDTSALQPVLNQLREVEAAQHRATEAANATRAAQEGAAAAARADAQAQKEAAQAQASRASFLDGLREQIRLYGKSSDEVLRFRAAQAGVAAEAAPLILQLKNIRAAHDDAAAAAKRQADAERQAAQVQAGRDNFVASLREQSEAIGKTRSELLELRAAQLGVTEQAAPFIARLREAEQSIGRTGISAGQTAFALRQVPAQVTDIVTSLQGGQAPLTVFLQQGGQLRDMFGSVGGAARALGGYLLGLVTPLTVAAAATVALAFAYHEGSKEADAFARALILSGNAAGTSTDRMAESAKNISKAVGTQGNAAEALTALASTGKVGADNLERFGEVAVKLQRTLGQGFGDTAKDFADLAKAPLEASLRLTDQYRYLTGATYKQIQALQDQGRVTDAATLAQKEYAEAAGQLADKLTARLGTVEKAWLSVKDAAKGAWDAMLSVGREKTLEEKLAEVQRRLANASKGGQKSVLGGNVGFDTTASDSETTRQLRAQEESLKGQIDKRNRLAKIDADKQAFNQAEIIWGQEVEKNLSRQKQLENELTANRNRGLAAGRSDTEIEIEAQKIRIKYADIYNDSIDSQIEKLKRRAQIEALIGERTAADLEHLQRLGGRVTEEDFIQRSTDIDLSKIDKQKKDLEDQLVLAKRKQNSLKEQADLQGQIDVLSEQRISREKKGQQELLELDVRRTKSANGVLADLTDSRAKDLQAIKDQITAQKDANALIGLSQDDISALNVGLIEEAANRYELTAAMLSNVEGRKAEADTLRATAQAMRDLGIVQRQGAQLNLVAEQQKALFQSIDQTARDTFISIFDSGKNAFDRLRDTLKNGLLDLLYQMTVKRWIFSIGAQVTGMTGLNDMAANPASLLLNGANAATGVSNAANLVSLGSSLTTAFNSSVVGQFFSGLSGSAGAAAEALGGAELTTAAAAGADISAAIAAIPGWGWAAMGAAALIGLSGLFDSGPEDHTRLTFASNNTPGNVSINERGNEGKNVSFLGGFGEGAFGTFGVKSTFWMSENSDTVQSFIKTVTSVDDALSKFLTATERASVTQAVSNQTITANTGPEGSNPNANGELDAVFAQRLNIILEGVQPGLSALIAGFKGTSQELATEAGAILQYRQALTDAGVAVFGQKTTLEQIIALKDPAEATSAALQRVTSEFTATNAIATALGKTSAEMFGSIGLASEAARRQIIEAAGGIDKLSASASSFAQNYLTETERMKPVSDALNASLASLGLSAIPQTRDEFKRLVQSLNPLNAEQAKLLASLLSLQEAFAQVHPVVDEVTDSTNSLADARDALKSAYDSEKSAIQATIDKMGSFETSLRSFRQGLLLGDLSPLTPQQKYIEARAQYERTLSAARGGDETAQGQLTSVAQAFLEASRTANASDARYQSDFFMVQQSISDTEKWAHSQVDIGKASLAALNTQVSALMTVNQSVLSVAQAISNLATILSASGQLTSTDQQRAALESLYGSLLGRQSDAEGFQYWMGRLQSGTSFEQVKAEFLTSPEYLRLHGSHANGLAYVPFDGYRAELHEGERVLTRAENVDYNRMGTLDMAPLVAEIKQLRGELEKLRGEQAQQTGALISGNEAANQRAAEKVREGLDSARTAATWSAKLASEAKPV